MLKPEDLGFRYRTSKLQGGGGGGGGGGGERPKLWLAPSFSSAQAIEAAAIKAATATGPQAAP